MAAPKAIICPSMLSSDFANLAAEAERMMNLGADWLHMDVMVGTLAVARWICRHFVPNLTLGAPIVKSVRKHTAAFLDCHLMVTNPDQWVDDFAAAGASQITFHIEVMPSAEATGALIAKIQSKGMKAGIAVKPKTPVDDVFPFADKVDMILIMTVEPGFGGQSFMPAMMTKVTALRQRHPSLHIQVDGGLGPKNIDVAAAAGANVIVAGTTIFSDADPAAVMAMMRNAIDNRVGAA